MRLKITFFLWIGIATYFTIASLVGFLVARNFDAAYGYRKETMEALFISFAFGIASAVACFGLQQRKPWSVGLIMALSGALVLYAISFFANNSFQSSGSWFVMLLLAVSTFSILAVWKKAENAQPQR